MPRLRGVGSPRFTKTDDTIGRWNRGEMKITEISGATFDKLDAGA